MLVGGHRGRAGLPVAHRLLDVAKPVLAEIQVFADEEGRAAERARLERGLRVVEQALLDGRGLRDLEQPLDRQPGLVQRVREDFRPGHVQPARPQIVIDAVHIGLEHAELLRRDRTAHQVQRVDRKMRIEREIGDAVPRDEASHLQRLIFGLVPDAREGAGGRLVPGELEQASEQDRHIGDHTPGTRLDTGDQAVAQERVRTAEIEIEGHVHR